MTDSRDITSYLKGLVIIAVIAAHYASNYESAFYNRWLYEYAIAFVSIFFVLSGYGLYHSLERRFSDQAVPLGRALWRYALARAVRIYPLYWLALIVVLLVVHPVPEPAHIIGANFTSVEVWLGIPVVDFRAFWFIIAILQCYWVSPFVFLLLKKLGPRSFAMWLVAFVELAFIVSAFFYLHLYHVFDSIGLAEPQAAFYKGFFLGHIVLFMLGMQIAPLVEPARRLLDRLAARHGRWPAALTGAISVIALGFVIYSLRFTDFLFLHSELYLMPLFFLLAAAFCLVAIVYRPRLPLHSAIGLMGRSSLSLYLFHSQWMVMLFSLGLITPQVPYRIPIALASLPLLLLICRLLEAGNGRLSAWSFGRRARSGQLDTDLSPREA